ncbi:MAG TPA: phosphoglycerate kinase [Patescibacteria group bacterium]
MSDNEINFIDQQEIKNKRVLVRVDFNVTMNPDYTIADDARITQSLPTINYLLENNNKLIIISHLDRPRGRDPKYSLKNIVANIEKYLPNYKITLVDDFLTADQSFFSNQNQKEIILLENIRFYPEEKNNNIEFSKKLSALADLFVNDAFGVSHRTDASVIGVPSFIPSLGGLLLKKEIEMISTVFAPRQKPLVAIIGGAKISTKINFINKLMDKADALLIGGGLANTFLMAQGFNIGESIHEYEKTESARKLLYLAAQKNTAIVLPLDVIVGNPNNGQNGGQVKRIEEVNSADHILDIGPETEARFGTIISKARTIVWNGPVGYIENPSFRRGTDFIYYAITQNREATSIVGGGDTIAAISKKEYLDQISHISTGGGAMLEFIEQGTLPGIEALK